MVIELLGITMTHGFYLHLVMGLGIVGDNGIVGWVENVLIA